MADKRFRIHGEARTEQMVAGMSKADRSLAKSRSAAEAMGNSIGKANRKSKDWITTMSQSVQALRGWVQTGLDVARTLDAIVMQSLKLQTAQANLPFAIEKARAASLGLASDFQLSKLAIVAFQGEVAKTPEKFAKVIEAGTKLGIKMQRDIPDSIERLVKGLAKGEQELLDELGILTKAEDAHRAFAETVGRSVSDLTDAEKAQAVLNARLDEAFEESQSVNIEVDKATEGWIKMKIAMENMVNDGVPAVLSGVASMSIGLAELSQNITAVNDGLAVFTGGVSGASGASPKAGTASGGAFGNVANLAALQAAQGVDALVTQGVSAEISRVFALARADQAKLNNILKKQNARILNPKKGKGGDPNKLIKGLLRRPAQEGGETNEEIVAGLELGGTTDPFADEDAVAENISNVIDFERAKAEVQLQERLRSIEEQRGAGVDPIQLIAEEENARAEFLRAELERADTDAERLRIQDELRASHFQARMMRMAEEEKRAQQHAKVMAKVGTSISNVFGLTAEASIRAAFAQEQSVGAAVQAAAKSGAIEMTIVAALETIRGLVAIWFNPVEAAAHFTNAGLAAGQAVALGAIAGTIAAARGGSGSAAGSGLEIPGAANGPPGGGGAGGTPPPISRPTGDQRRTPPSDLGGEAAVGGAAGAANVSGSRTVVMNFNEGAFKSLAPVDKTEFGLEVRQLIEDSERDAVGGT